MGRFQLILVQVLMCTLKIVRVDIAALDRP